MQKQLEEECTKNTKHPPNRTNKMMYVLQNELMLFFAWPFALSFSVSNSVSLLFWEISALDFARKSHVRHFVENRDVFLSYFLVQAYLENAIHILILVHGDVYYEFCLLNIIFCISYFPNFIIHSQLSRVLFHSVFKLCCFCFAIIMCVDGVFFCFRCNHLELTVF